MNRVLCVLALLSAVVFGVYGLFQTASLVLREEAPGFFWPRSGTSHVGGWSRTRGYVIYGGRSEWSNFRGGGPGRAK